MNLLQFFRSHNCEVEARIYCRSRMSFGKLVGMDINVLQTDSRMTSKLFDVIKLAKKEYAQQHASVPKKCVLISVKHLAYGSGVHHAVWTHPND